MRASCSRAATSTEFRDFLDDEGLYVAIINGFPYGPFHGTPVKASVYAPDWRDQARVAYTLDLIRILAALLPDGLDGGVSTAPLSYKPWMAAADDRGAGRRSRGTSFESPKRWCGSGRTTGALIHLDIEPEPDCSIENTDETLDFFERRLLPIGAPAARARARFGEDDGAATRCSSTSGSASTAAISRSSSRTPPTALDRIRAAGHQDRPHAAQLGARCHGARRMPGAAADVVARLRPFADTTYLHQVVERRAGRAAPLPRSAGCPGCAPPAGSSRGSWRIHFHVPLFTAEYDAPRIDADATSPTVLDTRDRRPASRAISRSRPTPGTCCRGGLRSDLPRIDRPRVRLGAATTVGGRARRAPRALDPDPVECGRPSS